MVITTDPGSIYSGLQYSLPPGFLKNIFIFKILAACLGLKISFIFELCWTFHLLMMYWVFSNMKGSKRLFNRLRKSRNYEYLYQDSLVGRWSHLALASKLRTLIGTNLFIFCKVHALYFMKSASGIHHLAAPFETSSSLWIWIWNLYF